MMSDKEAVSMLEETLVGRIGMSTENGPYIVPVLYLYSSEDNSIYIHSSKKGKKMEALNQNRNVCFEVDELDRIVLKKEVCRCTAEYRSVIVLGHARLVQGEEKTQILRRLSWKYGAKLNPGKPIEPEVLEKTAVIKIAIDQISGKANPPREPLPEKRT